MNIGGGYNNFNISRALKALDEESEKIEKEAVEIWKKVQAVSAGVILEEIRSNLEKALNETKPLLHLAKANKRIWIEADRELVKKEYLDDVSRLLPPILARFRDNLIIAYVPGTESKDRLRKIHEVIVWNFDRKAKYACSCDNYGLLGNIRTLGTCAHVRMVLYWLSGSLQKFYNERYNSFDEKDINFVLSKEEELKRLLRAVKKSIEEGKYEKREGSVLWRIKLGNIFIGEVMSRKDIQNYLKETYRFREWLKAKKDYFRELEKELSTSPFRPLSMRIWK